MTRERSAVQRILSGKSGHSREDFLFTFAVITDTHVTPEGGHYSPWKTNRFANARTRQVVREINSLSPDFVVHLGDIVHPLPNTADYAEAMEKTREIFKGLNMDFYVSPGNHDVGDKPISWTPAPNVYTGGLEKFQEYWGRTYLSFDHHDCHFILMNSQVLNSGLSLEREQREWVEGDLAGNRGKRVFFFTHYPPYIVHPDEECNYDNLDGPGRSWFLSLLEQWGAEGLFAGHIHNFIYNRYGVTQCYAVPSVTFVRHDYSEMYAGDPGPEWGRNDGGKLGFFLVDVYREGHRAYFARTGGAVDENAFPQFSNRYPLRRRLASREALYPGVYLRHPWAELRDLPYNGPLNEFSRKKVRNDYPLLALGDLGIQDLRIPVGDILDENTRARMKDLVSLGCRFTVFTFGLPCERVKNALILHSSLIHQWEVIAPWGDETAHVLEAIRQVKGRANVPVTLSKLQTMVPSAGSATEGPFIHFCSHGFRPDDSRELGLFLDKPGVRDMADRIAFRIDQGVSLLERMHDINELTRALEIGGTAHVHMAFNDPALACQDQRAIANRVAQALVGALAFPDIQVLLDTLIDHDRGYHVRDGLIDRRCNPKMAYHVFQNLKSVLASVDELQIQRALSLEQTGFLYLVVGGELVILVMPGEKMELEALPIASTVGQFQGRGEGAWMNLFTGGVEDIDWVAGMRDGSPGILLRRPLLVEHPGLLVPGLPLDS